MRGERLKVRGERLKDRKTPLLSGVFVYIMLILYLRVLPPLLREAELAPPDERIDPADDGIALLERIEELLEERTAELLLERTAGLLLERTAEDVLGRLTDGAELRVAVDTLLDTRCALVLVRTCVAVVFVRERVAVPATAVFRVAAVRALELSTRVATLVRFCVAAVIRSFVRTLVLPNVRDALFTLREETRVAAAPLADARELVRIAA